MKRKPSDWTHTEDKQIVDLVNQYGENHWGSIGSKLPNRTGKQCRDRWNNHLNPNIKHCKWSQCEDETIVALHQKIGTKWSEMTKHAHLRGRTDNNIKNRWNSTLRRVERFRQSNNQELPTTHDKEVDGRPDVLFIYCVEYMRNNPTFKVPLPKSRSKRKQQAETKVNSPPANRKRKRNPSRGSSAKRQKISSKTAPNLGSVLGIPSDNVRMVNGVPSPTAQANSQPNLTIDVSPSTLNSPMSLQSLGTEINISPLLSPLNSGDTIVKYTDSPILPLTPVYTEMKRFEGSPEPEYFTYDSQSSPKPKYFTFDSAFDSWGDDSVSSDDGSVTASVPDGLFSPLNAVQGF